MPELDPFDIRLTAAVRSFADRADTDVDAAAVAERASRRRTAGAAGWLGRTVPVPVAVLLLVALLLLLVFSVALLPGAPSDGRLLVVPAVASARPVAAAFVTGTGTADNQDPGTTTSDGGLWHTAGIVLAVETRMSDPRVKASGTFRLSADGSGTLGYAVGTLRLVNADGAWDGTCTGASWNDTYAADLGCWLVGSGAYEGLTWYADFGITGTAGLTTADCAITGTVLPGSPPSP